MIGFEHPEVGDLVGVSWQPSGASFFEAGLEDMAVTAFDQAGADGQTQAQRAGVIQAVQAVAQVAMGVAHRGFGFQGGLRFQVFRPTGQHLGHRPVFEAFLLGAPPLTWLSSAAGGGGGGQIFTDVKVVAEKSGLRSEDFPALQPNPIRAVTHCVDVTVQSPAGLPRAMAPTPSRFSHAAEGGPIDGRGAVFGLRRHQTHFLPFAWAFPLP